MHSRFHRLPSVQIRLHAVMRWLSPSLYSAADSSFCSLQVTGDPNVPAGKLSFCVSADNVKLGSYSGFEHEEVAPGEYANVYRDIGGWL